MAETTTSRTSRGYRVQPGRSSPLGATWDGAGVNFALFSAHAERVDLCLFEPTGRREIERTTCHTNRTKCYINFIARAFSLLFG
jgi:glycogen operon protein